ncbi:hypothetical protein K501DRAFT_274999 [Backusella circina FSU 941]|nr:hypothetical protein K501DRAFT_274999 [Backusella circina FSU 941]
MSNNQTTEFKHSGLCSNSEKHENQTFLNTVRHHFDEFDRLKNKCQEPATIIAEEQDIMQDKKNKKQMENKKKKADIQHMLISNGLQAMMKNMQPENNTLTLSARDTEIPATMREFITKMLGDMLSKVSDLWKSDSLPMYFQTQKKADDEAEIQVEVCTARRKITFWEKYKTTSLKLATLILPSELSDDWEGLKNDTLPYYTPKDPQPRK